MTTPVTVRGVTYPSMTAAARALGVTKQAVSRALDKGTLDGVGFGRRCEPTYTRPTIVCGVAYPSRRSAAAALGVRPSQLSAYFTVLKAVEKKENQK